MEKICLTWNEKFLRKFQQNKLKLIYFQVLSFEKYLYRYAVCLMIFKHKIFLVHYYKKVCKEKKKKRTEQRKV